MLFFSQASQWIYMQVDSFERNVNTQRWDNRKLTQVNMCEIFMNGYLVNYESYYLERTPSFCNLQTWKIGPP